MSTITEPSIPTTLAAAVDRLESELSPTDLIYIQGITMERMIGGCHHFAGRALRNDFRLWERDHPLTRELAALGFHHADDSSHLILSLLWRRINGRPWSGVSFIADLAEKNRLHWARQGVYPNGEAIPGARPPSSWTMKVGKDGTIEYLE